MLTVVGLGCGAPELLTEEAKRALLAAEVAFVAKGYEHVVSFHSNVVPMRDLHAALDEIEAALARGDVAVGVSGDPGVFSFLGLLKKRFADLPEGSFRVIPGIGALSCFFARLRASWHDAAILSGHGRPLTPNRLLHTITRNAKTAVFCDKTRSPRWVCAVVDGFRREFYEDAPSPFRVAVGENLSLPDERVSDFADETPTDREFSPHAIVAMFNADPLPFSLSRLRDDDFVRGDVPMTRQEVRSAVLDELRPDPDSIVWDIGAGTGSTAVALSRLCPDGEVHAVERAPEALDLTALNKRKFRAYNLAIHPGDAREVVGALPRPTHVFVGGSGGALEEILNHIAGLGGGIRVCVSSVTLETQRTASLVMMDPRLFERPEVVALAVTRSRPLGGVSLMAAQNPVTLWTGTTACREEKSDV